MARITFPYLTWGISALLGLCASTASFALDFSFTEGFTNQPVYYGVGITRYTLDADSRFKTGSLNIESDFEDSQTGFNAFFGLPYNDTLGLEFSLAWFGSYEFEGTVGGSNVGTLSGEQSHLGLGSSVYYRYPFEHFVAKASIGALLMRSETEGTLDLLGKPEQSLNYTESSGNLSLALEVQKEIKNNWHVAGGLSFISTSDALQGFSIKLIRVVKD